MDAFFSNSNAHAYSGGFNASDSDSGGASAGSTPPMGADFTSFDAGATWAGNADTYQPGVAFDARAYASDHHAPLDTLSTYDGPVQQQPRVALPPPPSSFDFDPENPFGDLFEESRRLDARNAARLQVPGPAYQAQYAYNASAFDNGFGTGSYGPPATSMGYPGFAPPAASHFPPPAASFSMQQPADVQHGTPATFNMGYAGFAPPAAFHPPAPTANSNTHHVQRYDLRSVGGVLADNPPAAGVVDPQAIESPPARGRKGKAGKSKARAGRARKHKDVQSSPAPASPVAGPSRVDDDGEYVVQAGWRDLDAQNGVLPSFLALQNANVGIPHAPLAPSEERTYPGGDVQDNANNRLTRGQSQGASANGQAAFRAARTAPGVTKDAPRDNQDRLKIHAPVANPQPPVKGKAVPVFEPAPRGKTQYCRECWENGDLVYWQDNAGMAKHRRDKHNEKRGGSRVQHQCIFECGFFKCSTRAEHFIKHRKATSGDTYCKPYHELEANGAVDGFLTKRNLHGHWQLGKKAKKGGRRRVTEEDEDTDADVDEDDDE